MNTIAQNMKNVDFRIQQINSLQPSTISQSDDEAYENLSFCGLQPIKFMLFYNFTILLVSYYSWLKEQ